MIKGGKGGHFVQFHVIRGANAPFAPPLATPMHENKTLNWLPEQIKKYFVIEDDESINVVEMSLFVIYSESKPLVVC